MPIIEKNYLKTNYQNFAPKTTFLEIFNNATTGTTYVLKIEGEKIQNRCKSMSLLAFFQMKVKSVQYLPV